METGSDLERKSIMQKSAHHAPKSPHRQDRLLPEHLADKGQKFEPFWSAAFGSDRRSQARLLKADQKR
jgi:hypothetical protein